MSGFTLLDDLVVNNADLRTQYQRDTPCFPLVFENIFPLFTYTC